MGYSWSIAQNRGEGPQKMPRLGRKMTEVDFARFQRFQSSFHLEQLTSICCFVVKSLLPVDYLARSKGSDVWRHIN